MWAGITADYIEGRLLATGGPVFDGLTLREVLNVTYSTLVDLVIPGTGNGVAAITKVDAMLAEAPWPTEDEWMEGSEAQDGQEAMMELFGPATVIPALDHEPEEVERSP